MPRRPRRLTYLLALCAFVLALVFAAPARATYSPVSPYVIGGTAVSIQQAPWQVFLSLTSPTASCGGAILDARRVLTAAHCIVAPGQPARPASAITVYAGVTDVAARLPSSAQVVGVSSVRIHPAYASASQGDDVAVLTLSRALRFTSSVRAIPLAPVGATPAPGTVLGISGYGKQRDNANPDGKLYAAQVAALSDAACHRNLHPNASASTLCAQSATQAACSGDSGGPLYTLGSSPQLVGVTSYGPQGGCLNGPTGFADVTAPEVRAFIDGAATVPLAPRVTSSPSLRGVVPPVLGSPIRCEPGGWSNSPTSITYTFVVDPSGAVLQSGSGNAFTPTSTHLGLAIACFVQVTNAGGTSTARTGVTAPLAADTVAPRSAIRSVRCRKRNCTLRIRAVDPNSVGPIKLVVRSHEKVAGRCKRGRGRKRRVVRCTRKRTRNLAVRVVGNGEYSAKTRKRLAPGRVRIVVQAIDAMGNKQAPAAKAVVRIR